MSSKSSLSKIRNIVHVLGGLVLLLTMAGSRETHILNTIRNVIPNIVPNIIKIPNVVDILENLIEPLNTNNLVNRAGYESRTYHVPTQPGYYVNLIEIINPLIKRREQESNTGPRIGHPVLFVHGLFASANYFVLMGAQGGEPSNWSEHQPATMSESQLQALIGHDIAARSLAFLLSNFGYSVWLMNGRSTKMSIAGNPHYNELTDDLEQSNQWSSWLWDLNRSINLQSNKSSIEEMNDELKKRIGDLKNESSPYWSFSYDEQAQFDIPAAIEFVLEKTGQSKVSLIGQSAGSLLIALTNLQRPDLHPKMSQLVLMAPATGLHYVTLVNPIYQMMRMVEPQFTQLSISLSQGWLLPLCALNAVGCIRDKVAGRVCDDLLDHHLGLGSGQLDMGVTMMMFSLGNMCSAHEISQLLQAGTKNQIYHFDYNDPNKNMLAYGTLDVPSYDFRLMKNLKRLSIWQGNTDRLVNQYDTVALLNHLSEPVKYHVLGNVTEGILFNHAAFLSHRKVTDLLNIPVLKTLDGGIYNET